MIQIVSFNNPFGRTVIYKLCVKLKEFIDRHGIHPCSFYDIGRDTAGETAIAAA